MLRENLCLHVQPTDSSLHFLLHTARLNTRATNACNSHNLLKLKTNLGLPIKISLIPQMSLSDYAWYAGLF